MVTVAFGRQISHTTVMKLLLGLCGFLVASSASALSESDLSLCERDADCLIVSYSHCCGSTKRAINKAHEAEYKKHPEWQKFDDPKKCAVIGVCQPDKLKTRAVCAGNAVKQCELAFSPTYRAPCHTSTDCSQNEECRPESVACPTNPEASHCVEKLCMPKR